MCLYNAANAAGRADNAVLVAALTDSACLSTLSWAAVDNGTVDGVLCIA